MADEFIGKLNRSLDTTDFNLNAPDVQLETND